MAGRKNSTNNNTQNTKQAAQHKKSYVRSFMTRHDFYEKTRIGEQVTLEFRGFLLL